MVHAPKYTIHGSYANCRSYELLNVLSITCHQNVIPFRFPSNKKVVILLGGVFQSFFIFTPEPWGFMIPNWLSQSVGWNHQLAPMGTALVSCWSRSLHLSPTFRKRRQRCAQSRAVYHRHRRHHPEHMVEGNVASCWRWIARLIVSWEDCGMLKLSRESLGEVTIREAFRKMFGNC